MLQQMFLVQESERRQNKYQKFGHIIKNTKA